MLGNNKDRDPRFANGGWLGYVILSTLIFWGIVGASCAYSQTIRHDGGGNVVTYMGRMLTLKPNAKIDGWCASACTIYLAKACVTPRSTLMFHAAFDERKKQIDVRMTESMSKFYPEPLREWFMESAAHLYGNNYVELSGAQVIALGAREC